MANLTAHRFGEKPEFLLQVFTLLLIFIRPDILTDVAEIKREALATYWALCCDANSFCRIWMISASDEASCSEFGYAIPAIETIPLSRWFRWPGWPSEDPRHGCQNRDAGTNGSDTISEAVVGSSSGSPAVRMIEIAWEPSTKRASSRRETRQRACSVSIVAQRGRRRTVW